MLPPQRAHLVKSPGTSLGSSKGRLTSLWQQENRTPEAPRSFSASKGGDGVRQAGGGVARSIHVEQDVEVPRRARL